MEIVDSQVHLNMLSQSWATMDSSMLVETAIVAMDAVGIDAVLIDERTFAVRGGPERNARVLANNAVRFSAPFSELAVARYPERFSYLTRIDRRDPDLRAEMSALRERPGCLAVRIEPNIETGEIRPLAAGEYAPFFAAAQEYDVPVFAWIDGRVDLIEPYLKSFPELKLVIDHCGISGRAPSAAAERYASIDPVLRLADYPNVSLKWCKAENRVSVNSFPYSDIESCLRRALDAFGMERVMWASDATATKAHHPWAHSLYSILGYGSITQVEKEWLFGRTARTILGWHSPGCDRGYVPWLHRARGTA